MLDLTPYQKYMQQHFDELGFECEVSIGDYASGHHVVIWFPTYLIQAHNPIQLRLTPEQLLLEVWRWQQQKMLSFKQIYYAALIQILKLANQKHVTR